MYQSIFRSIITYLLAVSSLCCVDSFTVPNGIISNAFTIRKKCNTNGRIVQHHSEDSSRTTRTTRLQPQFSSPQPEYSRDIILREEAESPFRKIRFFTYASLGAAAATSLLISGTRVLAGLNGINADLLEESLINCGVDIGGIIVLSFAWQRDLLAQNSRLKRAAKGAELAKLTVRVSKSIYNESELSDNNSSTNETGSTAPGRFTTSLASLRRGRGMEKRVVIAVGNTARIQSIIQETIQINDALRENDLLIVPVIIEPPNGTIQPLPIDMTLPDCVALPASGGTSGSWKIVIMDEMEEAIKQDINVYDDGFCIILKKNGRVGQRTRGIYLSNMIGDVTQRRDAGMDVMNI